MIEKIIIAGSGGQGIMLFGKILTQAAMNEGKFVTWLPSYGAEVRGGTAHCMVTISSQEIGSPYISKADIVVVMNMPSLIKFKERVITKGRIIINSSLADYALSLKAKVSSHPFTDMAIKLGNIKVANMIALGFLAEQAKVVKIKSILGVFDEIAPSGREDLIKINQEALDIGAGLIDG